MTALTDVELFKVHFKKETIAAELGDYLEFHTCDCRLTAEETKRIANDLSALQKEKADGLPFCETHIRNYIENLLIALLRKQPLSSERAALQPPIHRAIVYLNEHYRKAVTLEDVAAQVSLSPNYFGQLFKAEVGTTFHKYLNTLRLKFACNLLATSTLSVKEIAFAAGYNSLEYFMYIFKQHLRMTPAQYRAYHKT